MHVDMSIAGTSGIVHNLVDRKSTKLEVEVLVGRGCCEHSAVQCTICLKDIRIMTQQNCTRQHTA